MPNETATTTAPPDPDFRWVRQLPDGEHQEVSFGDGGLFAAACLLAVVFRPTASAVTKMAGLLYGYIRSKYFGSSP